EYIGFWTDPADSATWNLDIPAPGKYTVKLLYSCDKRYAGSTAELKVGNKTITAKVPATKNWDTFELMEMGVLDLNQVGTTPCTLGFGDEPKKALFNLKLVLLVPAE
ncbi:MAG: hypothetical protein ABJ118_04215, partial [Luteolibacter sp.]